jgi:hypothetical protein
VDGNAEFDMPCQFLLDVAPAMLAVLALPLEEIRREEPILVLVLGRS